MKKQISWDAATEALVTLVRECDADTLADIFANAFGGEVIADGELECLIIDKTEEEWRDTAFNNNIKDLEDDDAS